MDLGEQASCTFEVYDEIPDGWKIHQTISCLHQLGYSGELVVVDAVFKSERIQLRQGLIKLNEVLHARRCLSFRTKRQELRMAEVASLVMVEPSNLERRLGLLWQGICIFLPRGGTFDIETINHSSLISENGDMIYGEFANYVYAKSGFVLYTVGMANPTTQSLVVCGEESLLLTLKAGLVGSK
jgi:hypothetical protein